VAVLDTSFVIDLLRNRRPAVDILSELELREGLFVAAPTVMELWEGTLRSKLTQQNKQQVEDFLTAVTVLDFDSGAAKRAAEINAALFHSPIEAEDAMIAGVALARNERLVTRDKDYARIPGLQLLKY
jgi:predicted nucleic acid-binding protein